MIMAIFIAVFMMLSIGHAGINVQSCLACHNSNNANVPTITGQRRGYLEKQLFDFKFKNRTHPIMNQVTEHLSEQQIQQLALYFFDSNWAREDQRNPNLTAIEKGQHLAKSIGCFSCHGNQLQGQVRAPRIAGQKLFYLQSQLNGFHDKKRANDFGQMFTMTQFLTEDDIFDLANYVNSL